MKIKEFMNIYCKDILEKYKNNKALLEEDMFSYDRVITLPTGEQIKIIEVDEVEIPIEDILCLDKETFIKAYPNRSSWEARDSYLNNFIILEGEEALDLIRKEIESNKKEIDKYLSIDEENYL